MVLSFLDKNSDECCLSIVVLTTALISQYLYQILCQSAICQSTYSGT